MMSQSDSNANAGKAHGHRKNFGAAPIASIEDLSMRSFDVSPDEENPRSYNIGEISLHSYIIITFDFKWFSDQ